MTKKINKIILMLGLGSTLIGSTGCFKQLGDYGKMNSNPNATTSPVTSALLTNVLVTLNGGVWDEGGFRTVNGLYAQYFSETQYTDASRYARPTTNFDGFYSGPIYDLQNIINYNSDPATAAIAAANGSNKNQIAIARILKAYYFWTITDTWGDIPYSQALKGVGAIPYDGQDAIYKDLLKELKEAVAQFENSAIPFKGDILYGGNTAGWKKFANSLRLFIALRMSKADPTTGKTEFAAALADPAGVIDAASDNAKLTAPGGTYTNPFYDYYVVVQRKDYAVSKTIMDILSSNNDERINAFASSTVGFPYGLTRADAVSFANANVNYARILEPTRRKETTPIVLVASEQVKLARAEAAALGWTAENMITLYNGGIQDSWTRWGVYDATKFAAYIAQPNILLGVNNIQKIALQKWLAYYPDGTQGFAEWRRNGVPALVPAPGLTSIPRRTPYGPNEPQLNPVNYAAAAAKYTDASGPDSQYGKVWWDK
ncbi:SusD/RagB family nutrient-binding outer membrane lipoprotein [Asinibacterium sp. OR53]|uniref:SusD/RagB family nutrient-binding outer membrane lipoprotein n=1 Tax=Asinibacterium sp. OR53 TaxID=925409 RepID=UPI0004795BA2|nr:SusD/RagB family nutrient-binding outer membrane lipoprotein [Asinibacterium sp. OR53]